MEEVFTIIILVVFGFWVCLSCEISENKYEYTKKQAGVWILLLLLLTIYGVLLSKTIW